MEKNNKNNPPPPQKRTHTRTNEQQLFLENKNGKIGRNRKTTTPRAKEGYCHKATQKWTIHSRSKPPNPQYIQKHIGKTKNGLDKGRNNRN
jgi:hypothetical protein